MLPRSALRRALAKKQPQKHPILGTFRPAQDPAFAGVTEMGNPCEPGRAGGFRGRHLDPGMERGRALMWVAGVGTASCVATGIPERWNRVAP